MRGVSNYVAEGNHDKKEEAKVPNKTGKTLAEFLSFLCPWWIQRGCTRDVTLLCLDCGWVIATDLGLVVVVASVELPFLSFYFHLAVVVRRERRNRG